MSASTQIAVLLENDVLVSCDETDAITVEGSESHSIHPDLFTTVAIREDELMNNNAGCRLLLPRTELEAPREVRGEWDAYHLWMERCVSSSLYFLLSLSIEVSLLGGRDR